jgi:hypothetical protein
MPPGDRRARGRRAWLRAHRRSAAAGVAEVLTSRLLRAMAALGWDGLPARLRGACSLDASALCGWRGARRRHDEGASLLNALQAAQRLGAGFACRAGGVCQPRGSAEQRARRPLAWQQEGAQSATHIPSLPQPRLAAAAAHLAGTAGRQAGQQQRHGSRPATSMLHPLTPHECVVLASYMS